MEHTTMTASKHELEAIVARWRDTARVLGRTVQGMTLLNCAEDIAEVLTAPSAETRMLQAYPKLAEFFHKHGLGSKSAPSCFGCGAAWVSWEGTTQHLELPDIYLCAKCVQAIRSAETPPLYTESERQAWRDGFEFAQSKVVASAETTNSQLVSSSLVVGAETPRGEDWSILELRLLRQSVLQYANQAYQAADAYFQKGPQSDLKKGKAAQADATALDAIYGKLMALTEQASLPKPADVGKAGLSDLPRDALAASQGEGG